MGGAAQAVWMPGGTSPARERWGHGTAGVVQEQPPPGKGYLGKYGWRKENFLMILCFGADQLGLCHFRKDPEGLE